MLLRISISNTKNFLKKTFGTFKSFFSGSYQRLPKTPPPFTAGLDVEVDSTYYVHFRKIENEKEEEEREGGQSSVKPEKEVRGGDFMKSGNAVHFSKKMHESQIERVEKKSRRSMNIRATHHRNTRENIGSSSKCSEYDVQRMCLVAKKMKELEKVDTRNVDHALDIEEVLHYYSRLTCPPYVEIVERFFMDIFAEFAASSSPTTCAAINPRRRPEPVGLTKRRSRMKKSESSSDFF